MVIIGEMAGKTGSTIPGKCQKDSDFSWCLREAEYLRIT